MKKNPTIFITGNSTDVGKTIVSAIVVQALGADYWKPIQSGELNNSDTKKVMDLVENKEVTFFKSAYELEVPASPHQSAALQGIEIQLEKIIRPETQNSLVIEGAGGLFVPLNSTQTIADLISAEDKIILVSRNYLGSINHTMLTIEALKTRGLQVSGIIFNDEENPHTESWIANFTKIPIIGRIEKEAYFDEKIIQKYAQLFKENLSKLLLP